MDRLVSTKHMVIGYKVKSAIWSIFGWSHLLLDILYKLSYIRSNYLLESLRLTNKHKELRISVKVNNANPFIITDSILVVGGWVTDNVELLAPKSGARRRKMRKFPKMIQGAVGTTLGEFLSAVHS